LAHRDTNKKQLRLVLIASEQTLSDYVVFLQNLLLGLADHSIPVALVCLGRTKPQSAFAGAVELIHHPFVELPFATAFSVKVLSARLARFRPNLLHCLCHTKISLTRKLAAHLNIPYLVNINHLPTSRFQLLLRFRNCARIITPAASIAAAVHRLAPRLRDRITQVNIGTFITEPSHCFGDPSKIATMLVAHPFRNVEDFENLFAAIRHLVLDRYEFLLFLVGSGPHEIQLRKLLAALDLHKIVTILPQLQPWRAVCAAADIFIQPVPCRYFNPLLLQAMAAGTAVAAPKGGVDDLVLENHTALTFDPADELSILSTLQRLLGRRELARKIALQAQQHVAQHYSVSKMVSTILDLYRDCL